MQTTSPTTKGNTMTEVQTGIRVRTGHGTVKFDGTFTDVIGTIQRAPRQHAGWQSVVYKGKRYQLMGGVYTDWWINLSMPIKGKTPEKYVYRLHGPQTLEGAEKPEWELPVVVQGSYQGDVVAEARNVLGLEWVNKPTMLFGGYMRDKDGNCFYIHSEQV